MVAALIHPSATAATPGPMAPATHKMVIKVIGKVISASDGQPLLKNAKGKFIFVLDETGDKIALYSKGHPSLKGRSLFVNAASGTPEAAILIGNNPKTDNIGSLVREGYIVRTRADADTREARTSGR